MFLDYKSILIELFDALFSFIIIGFILAKFAFPWNMVLIGILILPFSIGLIKLFKKKSKE